MKKKIYYWSPFFSNIATIKAVINSALSFKRFSNEFEPVIIDVFGEWEAYKDLLSKNNILVKKLNLDNFFKKKTINGYIISRYYQIKIFLLAFFPLLKFIKKNKPDFIILHLITSLPLFLNFLFKFQTQIVLRISGLPKLNLIRFFFWNIFLKKINIITSPTKATLDFIKKKFNINKIYLIRDPVLDVLNIKNEKKNKNPNTKKFVAIGRLTKQKNFIFLLECFKEIIYKNSKINLFILGEGEDFNKLQKFIKINNLEKNIFLTGYCKNVYEHLKSSDAFILSSLWEDPGFVLIEAAYSNTLIISSNCKNGPVEIIDEERNGFLFESNNKKEFLKVFERFENSKVSSIYEKKLNAKKMSRKYSLFHHYKEFNKIL